MLSVSSKVALAIGITLSIAAVSSIFVTMMAAQNLISSSSSSATSQTQQQQQPQPQPQPQPQSSQQNATTGGGGSTTTATTTTTTPSGATQIEIPLEAAEKPSGQGNYIPENAQVPSGASVTWPNKDTVAHTATARDGSFDTSIINPGSSGTATVQGQGKVDYYCTIHPWMIASLTIGGPSTTSGVSGAGATNATSGSNITAQQQQQPPPPQQQAQDNATTAASTTTGAGGGFTVRLHPTAFEILPKSNKTDLGTEPEFKDDWITANHDQFGTRHSLQTTIGKNNVSQLGVKWILNSDQPIENPPLIIGDRGYAQDNALKVIAFDVNTGLTLWKYDPGYPASLLAARGPSSHGMAYDQGVIFAPTGLNGTIVALNATDGKLIWESASIGPNQLGYELPMAPILWGDYVIAGSALGDTPPYNPPAKGKITAFNRTNGEMIWNISTVTGAWVEGVNGTKNGGASVWSGGSLDPETGIMFLPIGNPAPDFDSSTRPPPNLYTNSIIAVDIRTGKILWATNTVPTTDEHDWDNAWGTSLANITMDDGSTRYVVIAQNKKGDAFALDSADGRIIWNKTLAVQFRTDAEPTPYGSGEVWPGSTHGIEDYNANDGKTAYFAASNMGFNYFITADATNDYVAPLFDAIENGIGNGSITAVDIKTGQIKWQHPTEFPTWVSPLVTNDVVFSGHVTATGKPYKYNDFGAATNTPLIPSGIIMALNKETGDKLWEFNVGAPIGTGGPSIGHGMLFVTTGAPSEIPANLGGYIVAFGLPENIGTNNTTQSQQGGQENNDTSTATTATASNATTNNSAMEQPSNNSAVSNSTLAQNNASSSRRTMAGN
jgi:alcohol dehydrogenase (cytochrome c)